MLAGQSWSLLTPNRTGISPLSPDIFYTVNLDTNYNVGLTWGRSSQLRFTYNPTQSWTIASSIENPQQYIGKLVLLPPYLANYQCQLNSTGIGLPVASGATCNNQVPNLIPDIVAKTAWDGQIADHDYHLEIGALLRHFGVVNPVNGVRYGTVGGGVSINGNLRLLRRLNLVVNTFASQGGGRFLSGLVPDVVARPDGSLSLVKAYSTLDGFEWGLGKNDLLYAYYGLVYGQKNTRECPYNALVTDSSLQCTPGQDYGFGARNYYYMNRIVSEPTFGLDHTFGATKTMGRPSLTATSPMFKGAHGT